MYVDAYNVRFVESFACCHKEKILSKLEAGENIALHITTLIKMCWKLHMSINN